MVDRQEVEALLEIVRGGTEQVCDRLGVAPGHTVYAVEVDTLAALCRAWLAVEEAPARDVVGGQWDDVFAREGNVVWCSDLHPGQRVRIVPVEGDHDQEVGGDVNS